MDAYRTLMWCRGRVGERREGKGKEEGKEESKGEGKGKEEEGKMEEGSRSPRLWKAQLRD